MRSPTLLITGAGGFTGRHLVNAAKEKGYRCVALAQYEGDAVKGAVSTLVADLLNPLALQRAVKQAAPDYIVHLAAISFVAHDDTADMYRVNQLGTVNLLEAIQKCAPNVKKILIASSANTYGNTSELPITEAVAPAPVNHYGMSKMTMELATQLYPNLPIILTRPFNYTGVGQNSNFLIPKIVSAFQKHEKLIALGNLDVSRDFSDVRDVVSAYIRLLESESSMRVFNICSGQPTALHAVIGMLNNLAGYKIEVSTDPAFVRTDEIKTLYGSPQRLIDTIGEYPSLSLNDTLAWMLTTKVVS